MNNGTRLHAHPSSPLSTRALLMAFALTFLASIFHLTALVKLLQLGFTVLLPLWMLLVSFHWMRSRAR